MLVVATNACLRNHPSRRNSLTVHCIQRTSTRTAVLRYSEYLDASSCCSLIQLATARRVALRTATGTSDETQISHNKVKQRRTTNDERRTTTTTTTTTATVTKLRTTTTNERRTTTRVIWSHLNTQSMFYVVPALSTRSRGTEWEANG